MRRIGAILIGFGVVVLIWMISERGRGPVEAPPPPLDLEAARQTFREGDPEASEPIARQVAALRPAPVRWLLEGLRDEDRNVREWSAHALGDVAPEEPKVVRALMLAFEDEDDWVRWKAARALGNIGPAAADALPMLEQAAADVREEVVHAAAQKAVRQILGK